MKFQNRSFVENKNYRPKPLVYFNDDSHLLVVLTPWGSGEYAESALQTIVNYLSSTRDDREATSPFQKIPSLTPQANALRTSILLVNDQLYKNQNKKEYVDSFEIFVGILKEKEFSWISYGHPHILLSRQNKTILPLSLDLDHALDLQRDNRSLPPLPRSLVGVQSYLELPVKSFVPQANDQLVLINRSWIPENTLRLETPNRNFDGFTQSLIEKDESAFWIGLLEF